jgi:hypothetical protein
MSGPATLPGIIRARHVPRPNGRCVACADVWPCATLLLQSDWTLATLADALGKPTGQAGQP